MAAFGQQQEIVDRPTDRRDGLHLEDAGHRLTGRDAIESVLGQGGDVVGDDDSPLRGRPLQHDGIVGAREANILDANDVERGARRRSPRTMSPLKFSSAANRSIEGGAYPSRASSRSRMPDAGNRRSTSSRTFVACSWRVWRWADTSVLCRR